MPPKAWTKYSNYDRDSVLNRRWQHEIRRTKQTERQLQGKAKDMGWRKQRTTLTRQQGVMDEYIETVGEVGKDFGLKLIETKYLTADYNLTLQMMNAKQTQMMNNTLL